MANVDAPRGLVPVRTLGASAWNGRVETFYCTSSATSDAGGANIYIGDIVGLVGSAGGAGAKLHGVDLEGVPQVLRVSDSAHLISAHLGVVVGFKPDPDSLTTRHRSGGAARIVYVSTDPRTVYEIQEDAASTPITGASIGLACKIAYTAGNATTGVSGLELDSDTVTTLGAVCAKIIGLSKKVGNGFNTAGADTDNARFEVLLNRLTAYAPTQVGT